MARWYVICSTCPVRIELPREVQDEAAAKWHLTYHTACYLGHDCKVTAQPNPKKRKRGDEEPNGY